LGRDQTLLLEVIVLTVDDARAATEGGADRLEVVRDIHAGGLTPPPSLVRDIQRVTSLPLRVMVRENAGFTTTREERLVLQRSAASLMAMEVDGIVVGFERDGDLALDDLTRILDAAPGVRATFHRAFERVREPERALETLARFPQIDHILTSGGSGSALERSALLARLTAHAGKRLRIIAGGGLDEESLAVFASTGCVTEAHVGRAAREGGDPEGAVSVAQVRRLRRIAETGNAEPA
jgi:copper homeostasis protein